MVNVSQILRIGLGTLLVWIGLALPGGHAQQRPDLGPSRSSFSIPSLVVAQLLEQEHYAQHPIDTKTTREWITSYLHALDYPRLYFLQSDVDEFVNQFGPTVGPGIKQGDLQPAHVMYQRFQQRLKERHDWMEKRFKQPFDFSLKPETAEGERPATTYNPDRSKASWPVSEKEADRLWDARLRFELLADILNDKSLEEAIAEVKKRYERNFKFLNELEEEDIVQHYLSALTSVFDPHSQYLSPSTLEDFEISMRLSLFGIGAVLTTEDGYCMIKEIVPGGPADLDKRLKENDKIVAVAQGDGPFTDIIGMKLRNAVKLIRGEKGTTVRLLVIPADAPDPSVREEIRLVRDKIDLSASRARGEIVQTQLPSPRPQKAGEEEADSTLKIGLIEISSFYGDSQSEPVPGADAPRSVSADVADLIEQMKAQGIDGLIIDLRRNGGGLLDEAVRLTGLFIDYAPVVQVKDRRNRVKILPDSPKNHPKPIYDGPLLILTSRLSASASEIFAGALQNYGRALIVGDSSTHGKGTVQAVIQLGRFIRSGGRLDQEPPNAGAVKLTIQQFYLPDGSSTQNRGVVPDITLPSPNDYLDLGESNLPHALPWSRIRPASGFQPLARQAGIIDLLRQNSEKRIATLPEYKHLLRDIEEVRARVKDRSVSLIQSQRLQEKEQKKSQREQRKADESARAAEAPSSIPIFLTGTSEADRKKPHRDLLNESEGEDANEPEPNKLISDYHLIETIRILTDLVELKGSKGGAVAVKTPPPPAPAPAN
ncbi:MAG: carboxy terminal-processing peptidase [Candidatus Methylacidiphilales bacterium]